MKRNVLAYADTMPADAYSARAAADVRSVGDLLGHVVLTNFGVCAGARNEANPRKGEKFDGLTKAELIPLLAASFAYCDDPFAGIGASDVPGSELIFAVVHNAQMATALDLYLTLHGRAPALSEMRHQAPAAPTR